MGNQTREKTAFIGIDGCRAGWFCVLLDEDDGFSYCIAVDAPALAGIVQGAKSVLIDVPIGLLSEGHGVRESDASARRLLGGKRAASVFPAPARQSLSARDYEDALMINRQSIGKGLSKQAWNIVPKIREIDQLLGTHTKLRGVLRECHPELCFWALNNKTAMHYNKKKEHGKQQRLAVLERHYAHCHAIFDQASREFLRRQVAHDDIIDAMACAVTAKLGYGNYAILPARPVRDTVGLSMEMVYWPG